MLTLLIGSPTCRLVYLRKAMDFYCSFVLEMGMDDGNCSELKVKKGFMGVEYLMK
jgi:hypothetical protein